MEDVEVHVIEYRLCPAIEDIDNLDSDYDNLIYSCPPSKQQRLVPIIQVFGRTKSNQTACVHVHNCYPTLYIGVPRNANLVESESYIRKCIETLLLEELDENDSVPQAFPVISARLVRGRNFYYYEGLERPFGEVRLLHPSHLIKAAERLVRKSEGCEIFAAHIPYEMQFLAAANISGMDMMSLSGSFKRPSVNQLTKCQLEFDIRIEEIDNAKVLWDRWSSGIRDCRATGKFPNSHLLTSLIKMVQEMGIETSTPFDNSSFQALQHQNRIDLIEKYQNQLKKIFLKCDLEKGLMQDQIAKTLTRVYNPVKESLLSLPSQTIPKPILYDVCSDDFVIDEFFLCEESLSPSDMSIPSSDWDFSDDQIIDSESDNFFNPANIKVSESSLNLSSNCEYTECVPESFDELVSENKGITTDNETHGIADEILNYVTTDVDNYAENWEDFSIPQYDGVDDTASESSELNDHELQSNSIYSLNNMWSVKKNVNKESVSAIKSNNFTYKKDVPTTFELFDSLSEYGMEQVTHRRAFISNPSDAGSCPKLPKLDDLITSHRFIEYSKDNTTATLEDSNGWVNKKYYYRFGRDPPLISKDDFLSASYIKPVDSVPQLKKEDLSQIRGPSQVESTRCGELKIFKGFSRNFNLTFLSCELLSQTCLERGQSYEKVRAIYCTHYSAATGHNQHFLYDPCESTMINRLLKLVNELDPDILVGWDLERSSFGIISSRMVDLNLGKFSDRLSRYKSRSKNAEKHQSNLSHPSSQENIKSSGNDFRASASPVNNVVQKKINKSVLWSVNRAFGALRVPGRLSINCWRMMRSELGLSHHDYDHVYSHVFGVHVPLFESKVLNKWFDRTLPGKCGKISSYFFQKCRGNLDLLSTTGVMDRTCEFARMLGVPLVSIISRGSQFRVESLLYRMGRIEGFLLRTPGRRSIKEMRAVEAIPLTMEPSSGVYWDPVVVLDFQSLYPSIAIAYNYCYSTCLGRVDSAYPKDIGCANVNDVSCHTEALCGLLNTDLTNHSISNDDCCESISKNSDLSIKDAQILNFMRDSNDNTSISRDSIRSFAIQEGSFKITDNPQLQKLGIKSLCTSTNSGDKLAPKKSLEKLSEPCSILVSPNRVAFVSSNVREGMLGKIFKELLEARTAIKKLIIEVSENQLESKLTNLERVSMDELNIRQMGLKLAANVIFGYTAASYSGRMPSVDVADSIVQTAREHLLKAKKEIEDHPGWGARVVYGDTDSLFVHLKGRSIREAVAIGRAMADYVTARCPMPVRLRYEKVYSPCVLLAKKRYYGLKYETGLEDEVGCLDARGIETVRRDSCPLVTKILEKSSIRDVSKVAMYVRRQFEKMVAGGLENLGDFIFSKEVKMEKYANKDKLLPPSASVAKRSGAIVLYGERVPYIVCQTGKGNRLADWAVSPEEMRRDKLHIHHSYYIVKQVIPVLSRVFSMIGVDVSAWWSGSYVFTWSKASYPMIQGQQTMDQFMQPFLCPICCQSHGSRSCVNCDKLDSQFKLATLLLRCKEIEKNMLQCSMQVSCNYDTVSHAANTHFENSCESIHCPFYWKRTVYLIRDQKLYERWKKINF